MRNVWFSGSGQDVYAMHGLSFNKMYLDVLHKWKYPAGKVIGFSFNFVTSSSCEHMLLIGKEIISDRAIPKLTIGP